MTSSVVIEPAAEPKRPNHPSDLIFEQRGAAWIDAASGNSRSGSYDAAAPLPRASTWQTVITFESERGWSTRSTPVKPEVEDRRELTRALQQELRRVGCYYGSADGIWDRHSKQAMKAFLDRVNSMLPINEPDQILLALIKGQVGAVCGKICPEGQIFAGNGRCLANPAAAELASDNNSAQDSAMQASEVATDGTGTDPGAPSAPLPRAMMIGGPKSEPDKISHEASQRNPLIENLFTHPLGGD